MKKVTSCLLIIAMLISIIYIPGLKISASGDGTVTELADRTTMVAGETPDSYSGTGIGDATNFAKITYGGTYYLTSDITLSDSFSTLLTTNYDDETDKRIVLDGRGYTVTTPKPLFKFLPPNTEIRNLVIKALDESKGIEYTGKAEDLSGQTWGALACRTNGGYFKNIVNNAKVVYNSSDASAYARVGGLIGASLYSSVDANKVYFENCTNNGRIASNKDTASTDTRGGVGGILGKIHTSKEVVIVNCKNTGIISNSATGSYCYAGAIVGSKAVSNKLHIINCVNTATIKEKKSNGEWNEGTYLFSENSLRESTNDTTSEYLLVNDAIRLSQEADLAKLDGKNYAYVANNFSVTAQSKSHFLGLIYGCKKTITCSEPMLSDMKSFTSRELTIKIDSSWTKITSAAEFAAISNSKSGGKFKYYLGANIDLATSYPNWSGPTFWSGNNKDNATNNNPTIILDGCGYTITTSKPIFPELPGGGVANDGTHSIIRNLKIEGTVSVTQAQLKAYDNGTSIGALVGKSNGGIYENIVNEASVTYSGTDGVARVGGIIGSVFNDDLYMNNCTNKGTVTASVSGSKYGVGGVIALVGYPNNDRGIQAELVNCKNEGAVRNNSTADSHVYAGGVMGVKYNEPTLIYLIDCANSGKVYAKTAYGHYMADRLQQNTHIIKTTPISTAEEFASILGKGAYSLANDITITAANSNEFKGFFIGYGHTVTTPDRLFDNADKAMIKEVNVNPTMLVINGQRLETFKIVAANAGDESATEIKNHLQNNLGIKNVEITTDTSYKGNAFYVNLGNQYYNDKTNSSAKGATRFGFDYEQTSDGFHVYLDGNGTEATKTLVNNFLNQKLPKVSSEGYDYFTLFGDKSFNYSFDTGHSTGLTYVSETSHNLIKGIRYIEKTYENSSGANIKANILVIEKGSKAHLEVAAAKQTHVSSCTNSANCNCKHVLAADQKTVSGFAAAAEATGKDVIAAVNGGYFMLDAGCLTPWGAQIVDGTPYREPWGSGALGPRWFGILNDGTPICGDTTTFAENSGNIKYAVNGKYYVIKNGSFVATSNNTINKAHDARTMIGYNEAGDIVIIAVAGNNNDVLTKHPGVTLADVAQMFMDLDMDITYALNLDGGGSTAMITQDSEKNLVLRTPQYSSDTKDSKGNPVQTEQRPVTDALLLVRD